MYDKKAKRPFPSRSNRKMIFRAVVYGPFLTYDKCAKEGNETLTFDEIDPNFDDDQTQYITIYES
jgi:hypothetical protein